MYRYTYAFLLMAVGTVFPTLFYYGSASGFRTALWPTLALLSILL